jgi:DNA-binding response OmpR family regulator
MARILIIDDDADIRAMLQVTFRDKRNDELVLAGSAEQGRHGAERDQPELIFVSLFLPHRDVIGFVQQLRTIGSALIVVYGLLKPRDEARFAALGPSVLYLPSPIEVTELLAARDQLVAAARP